MKTLSPAVKKQCTPFFAKQKANESTSLSRLQTDERAFTPPGSGVLPNFVAQIPLGRSLMRKLAIGETSDPLEAEADSMADRVLRMGDSANTSTSSHALLALRRCSCAGSSTKCKECEEAKREKKLHRKAQANAAAAEAPPIVHDVLRSPGQPLDSVTRAFFEPRFGADFSRVRIHSDARASESARSVNALAYAVGNDLVFRADQYRPHSVEGKRLMAHELTHVVQQQGQQPQIVQRDLATEPPEKAPPAQSDLTDAQIQQAIAFNRERYNEANTRLIQDLLGGPVTGTWTEENIRAIASVQEEYGLHKDGMVGHETFQFLNREQRLEGMSTNTPDCLVAFRLIGPDPINFGRDDATHCHFGSHHRVEAEFSSRCNCGQFQYRQFIRGHWRRTRGGVVTDLPIREPGGILRDVWTEDADVTDPVPNYGHRDQAAGGNVEDHYINARGADDQRNGCRYRAEDFPGFNPLGDCQPGDQYDLLTSFRGEIQRNGAPIQTKFWTSINLRNWRP